MSSPAEIVRAYLVNGDFVLMPFVPDQTTIYVPPPEDPLTVCYVGSMPDEIDNCACLFDQAGMIFGRSQRSAKTLIHPSIKLHIRTLDYTGYDTANSLTQAILGIKNQTVLLNNIAHYVQSVYQISGIISLGEELGKKRQLWTVNFRVAFQEQEPNLG